MSKPENKPENKDLAEPIGQQRIRTTNDFKKTHLEGLSKIATAKNVTRIAVLDEAFDTYLGIINDVADIDQLIAKTKDYWVERNLDIVKEKLPVDKCKTMVPFKKAYLFTKLKDETDRLRVFTALDLCKEFDELKLVNGILEKAANRNKDGSLNGYSLPQIANEIRLELSLIQVEFLQLVLGQKVVDALRTRAKGKFPELTLDGETVHDAVKTGKKELAQKLASSIISEPVDFLPDGREIE